MSNLPAYKKTIAALVGSVLTWGVVAQVDGITAAEWWGLAVAAATALGVYGTVNEPGPDDRGQAWVGGLVTFIIGFLLGYLWCKTGSQA